MVLLESVNSSRPDSLLAEHRMAPELLRLYKPELLESTNGVHPHSSKAPLNGRKKPGPASLVPDPTLQALTQLGVFRLICDQAFATILDGRETNVISHAVATPSTSPEKIGDATGLRTLGLKLDGFEIIDSANVSANPLHNVIHDIALESGLRSHPFVVRHPHIRFYAEVPLRNSTGETFGTYCVVDKEPRPTFRDRHLTDLQEVADAIANHLENVWKIQYQRRSERMLNALVEFVQSQPEAEHTERKARMMSASRRRSSVIPDMDSLSRTSSNSTRDISPLSTRHDGARSSFSRSKERTNLNRRHQDHARRCSDESSTFITVAESPATSAGTSLLFSRASSLIQKCLDLDGVVFLDAARSNSRSHSTASLSDWEHVGKDTDSVASSTHSTGASSHAQWSEQVCDPLGMAVSESTRKLKDNNVHLSLTEGLLHDMFTAFPNGEVFHIDHKLPFYPHPPIGGRRHSVQSLEAKQHLHHVVTARLAHDFPDANSLIFLPLWNWDKSRWLAGTLIWTSDPRRSLGVDDLAYLKTFGDSLVSEFSQLGWTATEQSKSDLLSSVSHELRSPLHGMLASAELLQTTPLEPAQRDMVTMVETCGLTLLDTMNYLLDFAKINNLTHIHKTGGRTDGVDLDNLVTAFDLDSLLEDVTESLYAGHRTLVNASKVAGRYLPMGPGVSGRAARPEVENRDDLSVVLRIEDQNSWAIRSISGAWRRIVMNILGNAFKFTRSGLIEVFLSKSMERDCQTKSAFATLSITDTGCGISPEFLEHSLYKSFAQESILTEGVGLGLSIVHQLVTYLGGTIDVKSEVGVGTQVDVRIPVEFSAESPLHSQPLRRPEQPGARTMTRVCLVGFNAYADLTDAPCGVLSTEAKRKLSIRGAVSNVLLSQPGWMVCFADSLDDSRGDIAVVEESTLKRISARGSTKPGYSTVVVLGERGISLPGNFAIEGAEVIYLAQPIGPRKITNALQRFIDSHHESSPTVQSPISGPFPGTPMRGRSLSDAFALAKGIESPPVMKENVAEFAPASPQAVDHKQLHVLIVDDNDINIKILATFMRRIGCSYETATNGQIALDKYKERNGSFDYILMDISMPVMDGIVSSSKIREYEEHHALPRAAIMAVTGVASSEMQQQAFAAGIDDYLVKPLSLHDLKRIMNIT